MAIPRWRRPPLAAVVFWQAVLSLAALAQSRAPRPLAAVCCLRPSVTVMVPNGNKARYLGRALASASAQTLRDVEVLVVDDRSTDGALPVVAAFLRCDARFRLALNAKPLREHAARAAAVALARGRFLLSLDSDDELRTRTAELDLRAALRRAADMVEHRALTVMPDGSAAPFHWPAPMREADNSTLVRHCLRHTLNWQLWLRLIERALYGRGLALLGPLRALMQNSRGADLLHSAAMYPFVRKFITIEYVGYVYYANLPDSSYFRAVNRDAECKLVFRLVREILQPFVERDPVLAKERALRQ
jgi:glycosyltransferase involved in cell wall biosynthesis